MIGADTVTYAWFHYDELRPYIGFHKKPIILSVGDKVFKVKANGPRLECFKRSNYCYSCGVEGKIFLLQNRDGVIPHLNLFQYYDSSYINYDWLMTKDHIIPKSKGGPNNISNYRTMCAICNNKKGNSMPYGNLVV